MKHDILDPNGSKVGEIELNDAIFNVEINPGVIFEVVNGELANRRQGTHMTKNRRLIHGGGRKPWKQKGTGRARQGSRRSPQWRGGATAFGPVPRDYSYDTPKKVKRLAYRGILSMKLKDKAIRIVRGLKAANGKTREMVAPLQKLSGQTRVMIVVKERDEQLIRALRNISYVKLFSAERLSPHELFYAKDVILSEDAATYINGWLSQEKAS